MYGSQRALKLHDLKKMYQARGARWVKKHLQESLEKGHLKSSDFSIRDLAEALIENGPQWLRQMERRRSAGMPLTEAGTAVDTTTFQNITGQIIYNELLEGYKNPEFLWTDLCKTVPTTFLNGERIAGIGGVGDLFEKVDEGQPYPMLGLNEAYVDTPQTVKFGGIIPITREAIIADRTGQLLEKASEIGHYLGVNKEKAVLDSAFGISPYNTYKRNGTASNTYLTSGAYVNSQSNTLVDHTDLENAELLLAAITDPNTAEPILNRPSQMVVPLDLKKTAERVLNIQNVAVVDNSATTGTHRMYSDKPKTLYGGGMYELLTSPYVKNRTSSATTWFLGDFKRAFMYMSVWEIEERTAPANSEADFLADIAMRVRCDYRGTPAVREPRFTCRNT